MGYDNKWFDEIQIESFVGEMREDMSEDEMIAQRKKLIILHQCGEDKEALISQLKLMIRGIEDNFELFAS